ncbi:MAG: TRAP transporter small permease subunit [Hyphomicrobiaceae bacterium]
MIDSFWRGFCAFTRAAAFVGGAMLLVAAFVVTYEIILRKIVSPVLGPEWNVTGSDEVAAYLFAVGTSWSLAYVVTSRANVRIDVLYAVFGPRSRAVLDLIALALFMVFVAYLIERAWSLALMSYDGNIRSNTTLRVPLAWAQLPWAMGLSLFALSLVLSFLVTIGHLLSGNLAGAARVSGAASAEEEVSAEIAGLGLSTSGGDGSAATHRGSQDTPRGPRASGGA